MTLLPLLLLTLTTSLVLAEPTSTEGPDGESGIRGPANSTGGGLIDPLLDTVTEFLHSVEGGESHWNILDFNRKITFHLQYWMG